MHKEIEIKDSESLIKILRSYGSGWSFRGHARSEWTLQPTLERILDSIGWSPELAEKCEEYSLHKFSSKAHHYIDRTDLPNSKLGWLSLMQHHGIPTRLLDFTESPFIALFFSLGQIDDADRQCAIWALNYRELMKSSIAYLKDNSTFEYNYSSAQMNQDAAYDNILDSGPHDILWVTEPKISNLRMERQRGTFLLSCNIQKRILDLMPMLPPDSIHKIIIRMSLANEIFEMLKGMGINHSILYGNLDGLAKDIKDELIYQTLKCNGLLKGNTE